ncbi:UDP-glycosyltransferase UGT5 [Tribolium castaneum]|uniref:UDP-glycosyltransferase UGT5 n=1 Tax=Tribolium castaneum TaxID=7070 RepID=UPI0030FE30B0
MKFLSLLLFLSVLHNNVESSKILVISSMPAHSHYILAFRLAKELADREHHVTLMSPYPQKTLVKNLKEVSLEDTIPWVNEFKKSLFNSPKTLLSNVQENCVLGGGTTEYALNNTNVQKLLNSGETFDVVILEHFLNEALLGIAHHFNCPVILLEPIPASKKTNYLFANPSPSSYVPDLMGTFTKRMSFWQRLQNFISNNLDAVLREFIYLPVHRKLFDKYFKTGINLNVLLHNISLMLTTSHPSVNDAIPHTPNMVEIGGYHILPPKQPPQDIQNYLNNASEGVVLFSMGSNLKSKDLTLNVRKAILNSFSKIRQKVLWKFEADLPEAPENVRIMNWLPQQDIIGHPNIRAFVTHGGLLSTIEAVYYGIPIIGIPVFGDQKSNIAAAVSNGYAIEVPLAELTEEKFSSALNEILNNPNCFDTMSSLAVIFWLVCGVHSEKILMVSTVPTYNYFNQIFRLVEELVSRKHEVTFINPYPSIVELENLETINIDLSKKLEQVMVNRVNYVNSGAIARTLNAFDASFWTTEHVLRDKQFQKLLNSTKKFDLVIVQYFLNEAMNQLGRRFNAPVIYLSPVGETFRTNLFFARPSISSYVPNDFSSFPVQMNFWQRTENLVTNIVIDLLREFIQLPKQHNLALKYIGSGSHLYNVSLMLCNAHASVHNTFVQTPASIYIGGYHIRAPKALPTDLQNYLDSAKHGVILFSLGTLTKSSYLKPEALKSILGAFSRMKQNVIWKYEGTLPNASRNVKTVNWFPQQDILAHPNVRAMITQGGSSTMLECVYFGVPVVGLPMHADQNTNIARATSHGYAAKVSLNEITENAFYETLQEVINNSKYKKNVQKRSKLMHDQPLKPLDLAVYWIEYVIRHKGAPHLRSAGLDLRWYQREMIDVIAFLTACVTAILAAVYLTIRKVICGRKSGKKPTTLEKKIN